MNMHLRDGGFDRAQYVAIIKLWQIAGQAALDADLGCPDLPGFDRLAGHVFERVEVGVRFARAAAEGAEFASDKTNVGEIDVAIDHVGDDVAREFGAQQIRGDQQAEQIVAFGIGQCVGFFE